MIESIILEEPAARPHIGEEICGLPIAVLHLGAYINRENSSTVIFRLY